MLKKNVVLVQMPVVWPNMPPIGLGYLQEFMSSKGINTDILDVNIQFYSIAGDTLRKQWLVSNNVNLEKNIFAVIQQKYTHELDSTVDWILQYEVAGFSCFKSNFPATMQMIKLLKKRKPDLNIILGGPELFRQYKKPGGITHDDWMNYVDMIVIGEGEKPLYDYLTGQTWTGKTALFEQLDNLNELPFPRYTGIPLNTYPGYPAVPIQFSRGCTGKCGFCSERLLHKGYRHRSIDDVIHEIEFHNTTNKSTRFVFYDSLLNASPPALEQLCDAIIHQWGSINWEAQVGVRPVMSMSLLNKMKKSGCYHLFIGLESGCDKTLRNMRKGFTVDEAVEFFRNLNAAGLSFGISLIVGYPGETEKDFNESLDFVVKNKNLIPKIEQINPYTYYEGTDVDPGADYRSNSVAVDRWQIFVNEIKHHKIKYTKAFMGNLMEKYDNI